MFLHPSSLAFHPHLIHSQYLSTFYRSLFYPLVFSIPLCLFKYFLSLPSHHSSFFFQTTHCTSPAQPRSNVPSHLFMAAASGYISRAESVTHSITRLLFGAARSLFVYSEQNGGPSFSRSVYFNFRLSNSYSCAYWKKYSNLYLSSYD